MNVRNVTIALIAFPIVSIIGSAIAVRELDRDLPAVAAATTPRLAPTAATGRIAAASSRGDANRSLRPDRDSGAASVRARRPVSSIVPLTPLAQSADPYRR